MYSWYSDINGVGPNKAEIMRNRKKKKKTSQTLGCHMSFGVSHKLCFHKATCRGITDGITAKPVGLGSYHRDG